MKRSKRFSDRTPNTDPLRAIREIQNVKCSCDQCQGGGGMIDKAMRTLPFSVKPDIDRCVDSVCQELPEQMQQHKAMKGFKIFMEYFIFFVWIMLFAAFKLFKAATYLIWRFSKLEGPVNSELKIAVALGILLVIGATIVRSKWHSSKLEHKGTCNATDKSAKVKAATIEKAKKEAAKATEEKRTAAVKAAEVKAAAVQAAAAHASPLAEAVEDDCQCVNSDCLSDAKGREIFRRSKLYAIPTEMKQPPHYLVHVKNILRSLLLYVR